MAFQFILFVLRESLPTLLSSPYIYTVRKFVIGKKQLIIKAFFVQSAN